MEPGLGEGGEHHTQNWEWLFLGRFSAWRATKGIKRFNMGPVLNEEAENPWDIWEEPSGWALWRARRGQGTARPRGHRGVPALPGVPLLLPSLELGWSHFPWKGQCSSSSSTGNGREGRGERAGKPGTGWNNDQREIAAPSSCLSLVVALPRF